MAYTSHIGKLYRRYAILVLLFLSLLVGPHINWKNKGTVRTRKTMRVVSKQIIQFAKAQQSLNLTQAGIYGYNGMDTRADTCCAGTDWKLVSLSNEGFEVSPFLNSYHPTKEITVVRVSTVWMEPTTLR